jgi:hypothetical protein
MRIASVKPDNLAVVKDDRLISVGHLLSKGASMIDLIARYDSLKGTIAEAAEKGASIPIGAKMLNAPVDRPSNIWAAATNYKRGSERTND